MGLRLRAGAGAPVGSFVAVSRGSVAIVVMFWFSALSLRSGFRLLRSSVSGSTAGRGAAPPDAGLSIENAQGAQRAHPRHAVGHPRLDRGVAGRGEVELGVAGLQASRHARGEALAGLVELLLRQALPLPGDGHLLLRRAEIEKGLAGVRLHLAGQIPHPDLLGDDPRLLLLGARLAPEAVEDRDVDADLEEPGALDRAGLPAALLPVPVGAERRQVLGLDGLVGLSQHEEPLPRRGEIGPGPPREPARPSRDAREAGARPSPRPPRSPT